MRLDAIGVLFSNAWRRYRERLGVTIPIFLVPVVFILISQLLMTRNSPAAVVLGGLFNLLSVIISIPASVALISAVGKGTDFIASYQAGIKLFWAMLWIAILVTLASLGGLVMLIIPGIILAVQLTFSSYALILEGRHGIDALATSRAYMKGYWWAFVGRALLLLLVLLIAMFIVVLPTRIILGNVASALAYAAVLLFFTPLSISYNYEIYDNLRRLKPNAIQEAAGAKREFLIVSMVVGIVGAIAMVILIFAAIIFFPAMYLKWEATHPSVNYPHNYPYFPSGTSTANPWVDPWATSSPQ